ncbi:MAG: pilus assembly PilX N-terminal domain-containing protein [Candidatus Omnitrophota bacterium]|nr:MAG: pilus assembly PilX N-terminal domain-containing protein [Candidatus Omnitrophota bacterium]
MMNKKGAVFITVMVISMLMIFIAVTASNMLLQDAHMIKHLKYSTQAQYLAESGISEALVTLADNGFANRGNDFPLTGSLGGGSFEVTVIESGERLLLSSVGTSGTVSRTVAMEVEDNTATSLYYMLSAGADTRARAFFLGLADFNGDVHANNNVRLRAQALAAITVDPCGNDTYCDGDVSARNRVFLSTGFFANIRIAGSVLEGAAAPLVTFPQFDYAYYRAEATAGGDYYSGDKTWDSESISPSNGITYVEGTATINGTCNLYGGLVADRIRIVGRLNQHKSGDKNVIIARGENTVGDIEIFYRISVEEALVYAQRDFTVLGIGGRVEITGALIAFRNIAIWNSLAYVTYNHRVLSPLGLLSPEGEDEPLTIISWNR